MKKFILFLSIILTSGQLHATHLFRNSASNINVGTLNSLRLDASSVTQLGPMGQYPNLSSTNTTVFNLRISTVNDGFNLIVASADFINIMGSEFVNFSTYASVLVNGAGGIDAGAADPASTTFAFYAIADAYAARYGCVLSTSNSGPSPMPPGFTRWRRLTFVRNDGSNNIVPFLKLGKIKHYITNQSLLNTVSPSSSLTDIASDILISTGASQATFMVTGISGSNSAQFALQSKGEVAGAAGSMIIGPSHTGPTAARWDGPVTLPVMGNTGRIFQYKNVSAGSQIIVELISVVEED